MFFVQQCCFLHCTVSYFFYALHQVLNLRQLLLIFFTSIYIYILLKHIFTLLFTTEGLECYHSPASFLPVKLLNMYSTVWPHPILVNSPKFISKTYLYIYIGKYTCYIFYRFCYIPVPMTCEYQRWALALFFAIWR